MILKTIERKLLSKPSISVNLPEETEEHFADLIIMLDSAESLTDFKEKMEKDSYFSGIEGVPLVDFNYTAGKLKNTKSWVARSKYVDDIYIQIAQYDLRNIIDEAETEVVKKEAKEMSANLDGVYKQIYSRGKK
jgi:hypothetical protein